MRPLVAAERGAAAIEYGIIAALISLAGVAAMPGLAQSLDRTFNSASDALRGYFDDAEAAPPDPASAAGAQKGKKKPKKPKKA